MIQLHIRYDVCVNQATWILTLVLQVSAKVSVLLQNWCHDYFGRMFNIVDICQVKNGGCDADAICSRDPKTQLAKCTCKPGYVNTGSKSRVVCTRMLLVSCWRSCTTWLLIVSFCSIARCDVKNGGCARNAICSYNLTTHAVICTCRIGFTNTGSGSNMTCTGNVTKISNWDSMSGLIPLDSCKIKNGGCDKNAKCSHVKTTNAVKCTCNVGFVNVGSDSQVICKREFFWNIGAMRDVWVVGFVC